MLERSPCWRGEVERTRCEPVIKINWPSHSLAAHSRGSTCSLEMVQQAISTGGVAACWVRPGHGGISCG